MNLDQPAAGNVIELAEIISDAGESAGVFMPSTPARRKVSKTSLLFGILGSISLMLLMEVTTVVYKGLSTVGLGCSEKNATQ